MSEVVFVVPRKDNAGVSLAREIKRIEAEILDLAGGFTREKVTGAWKDKGRVYLDDSFRYTVEVAYAEDITDRIPEWGAWLRQQAMYVSVREPVTTIVEIAKIKAKGAA